MDHQFSNGCFVGPPPSYQSVLILLRAGVCVSVYVYVYESVNRTHKLNPGHCIVLVEIVKWVTWKFKSTDDAQRRLPSVLLELPVSVIEWAYLSGLEPSRDAVEVEGVLKRERG